MFRTGGSTNEGIMHGLVNRRGYTNGNFVLDEGQDELLRDAALLVVQNQQASVSLLQRKFRIGYRKNL